MEYIYTTELPQHFNPQAPLYFDTETYGEIDFRHENIRLFQLYQPSTDSKVYVVDVMSYPKEYLKSYISEFNNIFGYNLLYDFEVLGFRFNEVPNYNDLYIASKLAFPERYLDRSLSWDLYSLLEYVGVKVNIDKKAMQKSDFGAFKLTEMQIKYSATDVYYLPVLKEEIERRIPKIWTHNRVYRLDLFTAKTLLDIHRVGLQVNESKRNTMKVDVESRLEGVLRQLPYNPLSPKQVKEYFGTPNANEQTLTALASQGNNIAKLTLEVRQLMKIKSFLDTYQGRVYGKFNVVGAKSGRMTCSKENLQQIPRSLRQIFGFTEDDDRVYVIADFPQIELRLAGAIWNEPQMIRAFKEGVDLHKYTASVIYNKSVEEVEKQERQISKSANFGLLYGMGAERFRDYVFTTSGIELSIDEAMTIKRNWLDLFSVVKLKHNEVGRILNTYGQYENQTWLGRKYMTKYYSEALNIQIQGSGAELLKTVVKNLFLKHYSDKVKVCNLIHDEVVIETTKDIAEDVAMTLKKVMEESWDECILHSKLPVEKFDLEVEMPDITKSLEKS